MVYCVKGSRKVEENKYYPFLTIKCLQDVVMDADEGCFSAVTRPIRTLERIEQRIFMVIVQRFIRTASSWYVLMLNAYMPQGPLAQCSIPKAYHYISLIVNNIGNKHY